MGRSDTYPEEGPPRTVTVKDFWIDRTEVSTARFAAFVKATGYVTVAERPVDPKEFPEAKGDFLKPGGAVFQKPSAAQPLNIMSWWSYIPYADWRRPGGPETPPARPEHPVTQVAFADAQAFAEWAGGRIPTEAEWEYAALAGGQPPANPKATPKGANVWQGFFPLNNTTADGFEGVAPVGCFEPNAFGLYDMIGNVWEWTESLYAPGSPRFTIKGGSYLCSDNYCRRYRVAARENFEIDFSTAHLGFRIVQDPAPSR